MNEKELCLMKKLGRLIPLCWTKETSADPDDWAPRDLSVGQCAVTALVVNDLMGGELLRCVATYPSGKTRSHYFNRLADGRVYDLTISQFPEGTTYTASEPRTRQQMLRDYPGTMLRYALLMLNLAKLIKQESTT